MNGPNIPEVAKYQRFLLLCILVQVGILVANVAVRAFGSGEVRGAGAAEIGGMVIPLLVSLVVSVMTVVMLALLMTAMGKPMVLRVLAAIAMFIPLVALIVLLVVNSGANSMLRGAGYTVGLMGAKK